MASSSDDEEASSSERFENLCRDLNMDEETSQEAWSSYQKISTNYTLEVPFVCLLAFVTCYLRIVRMNIPWNVGSVCDVNRFAVAIRLGWHTYF